MLGSILSAIALASSGASAQKRFGTQGQVAIGAERLTGVMFSSETSEEPDPAGGTSEVTASYTTVNLLNSYARVGFDFFVLDGFSLGAALGYVAFLGRMEIDGTEQNTRSKGFLLAPRLGYAAMFSDNEGIWPRAGITYAGASSENADFALGSSSNRLALSIEAPLVLSPVRHAAITLGPTLDLGLSGSNEYTANGMTQESDVTAIEFGAQAGLSLWF
jgi:hypothetical protein